MLKIQFKDRRKPAMWLVDSTIKIGSDPSCEIVVDEPTVDPVHVHLMINQDEILLKNVSTKRSVFINDIPVVKEHTLKAWDVIKVGKSELEIIDPLTQRNPAPVKQTVSATVIRPVVSPWMLKADSAPLNGQYFSLSNGFIIGRDDEADIKLPFSYVSRKHCKIIIRDEKLFIEDLDSSNGTYLNGAKIKTSIVQSGDEIRLDQFVFHVIGADLENKTKVPTKINEKNEKPVRQSAVTNPKEKNLLASKKVFLHGLSGDVKSKVFEITQAENHISRLLGHHLSTSERSVSARHVYLTETETGWMIKNNGASDGLLVNGKMQARSILQDGDELIIGGTLLKFQSEGDLPHDYNIPEIKKISIGKFIWVAIIVSGLAAATYFSGVLS